MMDPCSDGEHSSHGEHSYNNDENLEETFVTDGVARWEKLVELDTQARQNESSYNPQAALFSHLYWLVKVKSERIWEPAVKQVGVELRSMCVDRIQEIDIYDWRDLVHLFDTMSQRFVLAESVTLPRQNLTIHGGSRALKLASLHGCHLDQKTHERFNGRRQGNVALPVKFFMRKTADDVTNETIVDMRAFYTAELERGAEFITRILEEVNSLLSDVDTDCQMNSTLEGKMPSPPPISHRYLKHCEGRELQEDARTPRADEAESSDEDQMKPDGICKSHTGSMKQFHDGKRIERNHVLNEFNKDGHH